MTTEELRILALVFVLLIGMAIPALRPAFAKVVSFIFHPLLMATYGCLLMFYGIRNTIFDYMTSADVKWRISLIVFLFSFLFPALNIVVLYKLKRLPSLTLSNPADRTFPYIMTSMFYFGLFYLLKDVSIWNELKLFVLGAGLAILLCALINTRTKISAHMTGVGGLFGSVICLSYMIKFDMTIFYIICLLVAGIVASARLFLKEHRPAQLYMGFFLGLIIQTLLFFIFERTEFI